MNNIRKQSLESSLKPGYHFASFHRAKISVFLLSTLHRWRDKYSEVNSNLTKSRDLEDWSAEQKFSTVIETATMPEVELSEYLLGERNLSRTNSTMETGLHFRLSSISSAAKATCTKWQS